MRFSRKTDDDNRDIGQKPKLANSRAAWHNLRVKSSQIDRIRFLLGILERSIFHRPGARSIAKAPDPLPTRSDFGENNDLGFSSNIKRNSPSGKSVMRNFHLIPIHLLPTLSIAAGISRERLDLNFPTQIEGDRFATRSLRPSRLESLH